MRRASALLPYALASAAVVLASLIAVGATFRQSSPGAPPAQAPPASASASPVARAGLSETARLAYWRRAQGGSLELWVSDLDGGRRWRAATMSAGAEIALTRWSVDGSAVAYTLGGTRLGVVRLDGTLAWIDMPYALRSSGWKIVSLEWSPDASRVAATFRGAQGVGNESDVYLVDARAGATWERLTMLEDAFAGGWIDRDRLFIETVDGVVLIADAATGSLRPLTAASVTSPIVGRDGRVYLVHGGVQPQLSGPPAAGGSIVSMTIDGRDVRTEMSSGDPNLAMRLVGMLADGRAAVMGNGFAYFLGDRRISLQFPSGLVRKVAVSDDGARVVGMTESGVLLIDPSRIRTSQPASATTLLLSGVRDPDAWFPRPAVPLAHAGAPAAGGPRARLAFTLGRTLWLSDADGAVRGLLTDGRAFVSRPVWSPAGDRLAAVRYADDGTAVPFVLRPDGSGRVDLGGAVGYRVRGVAWTGDGRVAVQLVLDDRVLQHVTRVYDGATGRLEATVEGRASWVGDREIVLTDGDLDIDTGNRVEQRIVVREGATERVLTDARRLAADPLLADLPDQTLAPRIDDVEPTADPALLAVWLQRQRFGGYVSAALAVVRISDGAAVWRVPFSPREAPSDVAFGPAGRHVGWSARGAFPSEVAAHVVDISTGATVVRVDGRFAGWSPDGASFYVARLEGLFAYRLDGSGLGVVVEPPAYVGPYGVPVAAARP